MRLSMHHRRISRDPIVEGGKISPAVGERDFDSQLDKSMRRMLLSDDGRAPIELSPMNRHTQQSHQRQTDPHRGRQFEWLRLRLEFGFCHPASLKESPNLIVWANR